MTNSNNTLPGPQPWPSAQINWQINGSTASPQLHLQFGFSTRAYEGLYHLAVTGVNEVTASFTCELDAPAATAANNYSVSIKREPADTLPAKVISVILNTDGKSVIITVDKIEENKDQRLVLEIRNIAAADGSAIFHGKAECSCPASDAPVTSPATENAQRDLQFYKQLGAEPTGVPPVKLSVESTLLKNELKFTSQQFASFKEEWLTPVCTFLTDRAAGALTVAVPVKTHAVDMNIDIEQLCTDELFRLNFALLIRRGAEWNMLALPPYTESAVLPCSFEQFALQFERVLQNEKWMLRVLQQSVKTKNGNSPAATELWAVRKGLQADQAISFSIDSGTTPKYFAVRPVSNRVEAQTNVPIYDFNPATGMDYTTPSRHMSFVRTDLDGWMKFFLRSVDDVLSPAYVTALRLVDEKSGTHYHPALPFRRMKLAEEISKWLIPVFESGVDDTSVVRESFRRKLLTQLSCAYDLNTAVQLHATITADKQQDTIAQFSGPVTLISDVKKRKSDKANSSIALAFTHGELNVEAGPDRPFTFMVSSAQTQTNDHAALECTADVDLQFSASSIGNSGDGKTDPWQIDFVTEEGSKSFSTRLGELQLPLLLRVNPMESHPVLVDQSGQASASPAIATFDALFDWDYTFRYSRVAHAPQDIVSCSFDFSGKKEEATQAVAPAEIFAPLAQFAMVFPAVERVFTGVLAKIDDNTDTSQIALCNRALDAFTKMTDRIISAISGNVPATPPHTQANNELNFGFNVAEGRALIDGVEALIITIHHNSGNSIGDLAIQLDNCVTVEYKNKAPGTCSFYFKDRDERIVTAYDGQHMPMRTIVVRRMNIMQRQQVETKIALSRNAELIPGKNTAEPLVYRIGAVNFPDACRPFIEHHSVIDMSMIFGDGKNNVVTLIEHLEHLFIRILGLSQQRFMSLEVKCSYCYPIAEGISDATLPVIMVPFYNVDMSRRPYAVHDITLQKVIERLSEEIKTWYRNYNPPGNGASFGFDILFSSMLTGEPQPLLHLRSLTLGVKYITDL